MVPGDKLKKLQAVVIVLDLTHGKLGPMQYHPSADWLKANGYATDLEKCVHIPRAADLPTIRNIREQPWVILHELAHAYHDQVLSFEEPRIIEAYEKYKKSGHGDKTLLYDGRRVRHYALTNQMEFFAEMTEAYFGVNDFFPFNRAELKEAEPEIFKLLQAIWGPLAGSRDQVGRRRRTSRGDAAFGKLMLNYRARDDDSETAQEIRKGDVLVDLSGPRPAGAPIMCASCLTPASRLSATSFSNHTRPTALRCQTK